MRIILITPAPPTSRAGNRATAARWADILRSLDHHVEIATDYEDQQADLMIALHAWRSAKAIQRFAEIFPNRPLIVAITGTDAYRFIHSHPETTLQSIRQADHLVGLHDLIKNTLPDDQRHKMHVIYQSAAPITKREPLSCDFHVSVMGHLREEKDPMRPALAVRNLPANSRVKVHHYGKAHSDDWAEQALAEMKINPRYIWHGEIAHHKIRAVYERTHLLVLPSRMEGGANVISEAVAAGVPIIASDIEGSVGLLGEDYPGYYPVEDEIKLSELLLLAESDTSFYQTLEQACVAKQELFTPERECKAWRRLLKKLPTMRYDYDRERDYYDNLYRSYQANEAIEQEHFIHDLDKSQHRLNQVLAFFKIDVKQDESRVLDVGCGPGYFSEAFRRLGAQVTGVDISEAGIETATKTFPGCRFINAQFPQEFSTDEPFDIIWAVDLTLIDTFDTDYINEQFIAPSMQRLTPNGTLIIGWHTDFSGQDNRRGAHWCHWSQHTFAQLQDDMNMSQPAIVQARHPLLSALLIQGCSLIGKSAPIFLIKRNTDY